jgi:NADH-quinone oxidoreductase subunit M
MLTTLVFLPLAAGLAAALVPGRGGRWLSSLGALAALALAVAVIIDFESGEAGLQHAVDEVWISSLGIHFKLGVDGINLFLVALTALLWLGATVWSAFQQVERERLYFFMLALGETATLGAFLAQDLALFVVFFDLMLVPFYFLIGAWGGERRVQATTKFVIYTLVGSLLMLVAAVAVGILSQPEGGQLSFALSDLQQNLLPDGTQTWVFLFFAAAFLVKMPAFLVHGWMPDAYRAAPLPVLVVLSGVLSKVGAYAFIRIVLPLFPDATVRFQELVLLIAVASILYGSVMAFSQMNVRLVAGYSSVAQLGFITLGIFSLRPEGSDGAVLQMVNHGLVVGPIFFVIAVLATRARTEDLGELGGVAFRAPVLAALFLVVTVATLAMPGSANFVGELYILVAVFKAKIVYSIVAFAGVALAAFYALRLFQRSMHNPKPAAIESRELSWREGAVIAPIVACIVALALYPQLILERADPAVERSLGVVRAE